MSRDPRNVFVNLPFDEPYKPLFEAVIFAITASGYRIRCALEEDDSGDIRIDKLDRLIRESPLSVHDLSRTELGANDLPRFNMPFELGLAIGARRFGSRTQKFNKIKIMVAEPYRLPAYLSDLGGNDPAAHHSQPETVIRIVRDFLHETPDGGRLPGPARFYDYFQEFKRALPDIAEAIEFRPEEICPLAHYRDYLWCVADFLRLHRE